MPDIKERLQQRVQALMPDLEITQFEINREGLINDVAIVNGQWVFRFAKTPESARILARELKILDLVRPRLELAVPAPAYRGEDAVVYPYLEGEPLLRVTLYDLEPGARARLAEQLGAFLFRLHTTESAGLDWEIPPTIARHTREQIVERRSRVREIVYPLLLKHQVQWAERLFDGFLSSPEAFEYEPALIHGDLAPYHILYDPRRTRITGVIDFGVSGMGDPAQDLGILITAYGERWVRQCRAAYPGLDRLLPRARFYAQAIELEWVLLGLETGEPFWFTAHLGGARDIG